MLTFEDCADFCDLTKDEIQGLAEGTHLHPVEVCALVQRHADNPRECRKMLGLLQEYLERVECHADAKRSHEVHEAINHFASNHPMI
ncbi:MAG: hypothetical protein OQK12_00510 [Motiliproteus sp.]|nr:hypothetical protein [Motiliproteus sp.]MCW9053095.1 hypothetical protein [Motiliproteus sp.]